MRTLSAVLTLALALSVVPARAAEKLKADTFKGQVAVLVERIQDLHLTDAQEAKIAEIRKEGRPKIQEAARAVGALVKDEVEKVRDVLTAEQKEKIQDLKEERREHREQCVAHVFASLKDLDLTDAEMTRIGDIRKEFRPKLEKAMKQLEGFLTDAQKKIREEALTAGKTRREILEAFKLTDEQKDKVVTVAKDVSGLVREETEKLREVLAESLKEKLQELKDERKEQARDRQAHRIANFKDLNLTDEQQTKLANIRQEFRPKIHEAGNKLRAAIREEVEMVLAVIK